MIPKILHFIWLGPIPVPRSIQTWKNMHPNWKIMLWTEEKLKEKYMVNRLIYDLPNKKYNQKSDVVRLELLYRYGGVYIDADIVCLSPIDNLFKNKTEMLFVQEKLGLMSNSIIASTPKNRTILNLMQKIKKEFTDTKAVWKSTGPGILTNFLTEKKIIKIPSSHTKIDIISQSKNIIVLPYYVCNFMYDIIKTCRNKLLTPEIISRCENNRDLKYLKYNNIDKSKIIGIQLWMGGKKENYSRDIDDTVIKYNFFTYLIKIFNCKE